MANEDARNPVSLQDEGTTVDLSNTDYLFRCIDRLRPTSECPYEPFCFAKMPRTRRENILRLLAFANDDVEPQHKIPDPRMLEVFKVLVKDPIERIEFMPESPGQADMFFLPAIEGVAESNSHSIRLLRVNLICPNFWSRPEGLATLKFRNLRELRMPGLVMRTDDFDKVTSAFQHLTILECNLHFTLNKQTMAMMLRRLKKLRNFLFDVVSDGEEYWTSNKPTEPDRCIPYSRLLVQQFPFLTVIGCDPDLIKDRLQYYHEWESSICHVLDDNVAEALNGASGLKHLFVRRRMHPRQAEWHSESAETLFVVGLFGFYEWESLCRLRKIRKLITFNCCPSRQMVPRLRASVNYKKNMQMFLLKERSAPDIRLFMTINPLPATLDGIVELHFYDLPKNMNRMVHVMRAPDLTNIHLTVQNLQRYNLKDVTDTLRSRKCVARSLRSLIVQIQEPLDLEKQAMLGGFLGVICQKAPNLQNFQIVDFWSEDDQILS
ncbi:Hypothetical predicted protein [Cloeon dipterum]|uniref:Uncharacterized protein n=1 Tax=Cloeon dipterum TaxID=197152 RepID=A0A8S1E145_9INSE|nr:Hypothetical predicted protein [Cloeon dipterum]